VKDYAIEKYVALLAPVFPEEDPKLVIVRNLALNQDHAMVATRVGGEPGMDRLLDRFCPGKMIVEPVPPVAISCFYHPTIAG
jgi:hypothetical protein